jgi:hypothetical protein
VPPAGRAFLPTFVAAATYGAKAVRSLSALLLLKSMEYAAPSKENETVTPLVSLSSSPVRSSTNITYVRLAIGAGLTENIYESK